MDTDLLGDEIKPEPGPYTPRGYAADPGSGPDGKFCKDCSQYCRVDRGGSKHHLKCGIIEHRWTCGPGTDIKASSPACRMFENG